MTQPAGWYPDPGGQGQRWWDGEQWATNPRPYPPPTGPVYPAQPQGKPMRALGPNQSPVAIIAAAVLIAVIVIALIANSTSSGASNHDAGAKDVCHQNVEAQLKAPGTARYTSETVTHSGDDYTVEGAVDSENGFGALLRSRFVCTATFVSGDFWKPVTADLTPQ